MRLATCQKVVLRRVATNNTNSPPWPAVGRRFLDPMAASNVGAAPRFRPTPIPLSAAFEAKDSD
jgi:hypothetical protein